MNVLNITSSNGLPAWKEQLVERIGKSYETVVFSPESINQLAIYHPDDDPGGLMLLIIKAKLARDNWLVSVMDDKGGKYLVANINGRQREVNSKIQDNAFFAIPVEERIKRHPIEQLSFWAKLFKLIRKAA